MDRFLDALVTRTARFRFHGHDLTFDLSTALFSSAGVDQGSQLLLRCVAESVDEALLIRDIGSGTGTLGIALAALYDAPLVASDRDALASWFTDRNARANRVECTSFPALGAEHDPVRIPDRAPGVTVCNIPAKAGEPVIRHLVETVTGVADGYVGLVIVAPLAEQLLGIVDPSLVVAQRRTNGHLAVVLRAAGGSRCIAAKGPDDLPAAYVRSLRKFDSFAGSYELSTSFNLPEFDTRAYDTDLVMDLMKRRPPRGNVLVWGAGQGHIPAVVARVSKDASLRITDRDLLAVKTAKTNTQRYTPASVETACAPGIAAAAVPDAQWADWMIVRSAAGTTPARAEEIAWAAERVLHPDGKLIVASRSSAMARLDALRTRFDQEESVKYRGYRADLLRRKH